MQTYIKLLPFVPLLLSAGCAVEKRELPAPELRYNTEDHKSAPQFDMAAEAQWQKKLAAQIRSNEALQLQLLVKQAEFNQLKLSHDRAIQDLRRANARLRNMDNKAEAIADIAEAALMIKSARETEEDEPQPALIHAEKLLEESRQALQSGNVSDASYLAAKASELTLPDVPMSDQERSRQSSQVETVFNTPLVMKVTKYSNIRERPTRDSNVLFQLANGTLVNALGYDNLWIRVVVEDLGEGWIYYRLLEAADPSGQ